MTTQETNRLLSLLNNDLSLMNSEKVDKLVRVQKELREIKSKDGV